MEASGLSCERCVDISMCIHPDHSEVWALPCMATDRTKCQAGSTATKSPSEQLQRQWAVSRLQSATLLHLQALDMRDNKGSIPDKLHGMLLLWSGGQVTLQGYNDRYPGALCCHPSHTHTIFTCSRSKHSRKTCPFFYSSHDTFPHNSFLHALPSSPNSQTKG